MNESILFDPDLRMLSLGGDGQGGFCIEFTYRGLLFKRVGFAETSEAHAWVLAEKARVDNLPPALRTCE